MQSHFLPVTQACVLDTWPKAFPLALGDPFTIQLLRGIHSTVRSLWAPVMVLLSPRWFLYMNLIYVKAGERKCQRIRPREMRIFVEVTPVDGTADVPCRILPYGRVCREFLLIVGQNAGSLLGEFICFGHPVIRRLVLRVVLFGSQLACIDIRFHPKDGKIMKFLIQGRIYIDGTDDGCFRHKNTSVSGAGSKSAVKIVNIF